MGCYPSEPTLAYGLRLVRPSRVLLVHNCWCEDRHSCSALQEVPILTMLRAEYLRIIRSYAMQRLCIVSLNVEVESDDPRMTLFAL